MHAGLRIYHDLIVRKAVDYPATKNTPVGEAIRTQHAETIAEQVIAATGITEQVANALARESGVPHAQRRGRKKALTAVAFAVLSDPNLDRAPIGWPSH